MFKIYGCSFQQCHFQNFNYTCIIESTMYLIITLNTIIYVILTPTYTTKQFLFKKKKKQTNAIVLDFFL